MPEPWPYRMHGDLLALLASSEAWVEPTDCETHPFAISFYIHESEVQRLPPAPVRNGKPRLFLVE